MSFTPKNWLDYPSTSTPVDQAALEDMETRLSDYSDLQGGAVFNAKEYGATGDGTSNDFTAIQAALDAAGALATGQAFGGQVYLPAGSYRIGGATGLQIPDGVSLVGAGAPATEICPLNSFTGTYVLRNQDVDRTQEYCFIEKLGIRGNKTNVSGCDGILLDELFANSYVRDVIVWDCSGAGIHRKASAGSSADGPFVIENVWVNTCNLENILIEAPAAGTWIRNVTAERAASGKFQVRFQASDDQNGNCIVDGLYMESDAVGANALGLWIEDTVAVSARNVRAGLNASGVLVRITGSSAEDQFGATNISLSQLQTEGTAIDDQVRSVTVAGPLVTAYHTNRTRLETLTITGSSGMTAPKVNFNNGAVDWDLLFSGNTLKWRYVTGGSDVFQTETDASFRHVSTKLGFYGTAATTKPTVTGAKGGNAALGSLLTALVNLGLITDSSSA